MLSSRLGRVGGLAILVGAGAAVVAGGSGIATAEPSDGSATRSHSASAATAAHPVTAAGRVLGRTDCRPPRAPHRCPNHGGSPAPSLRRQGRGLGGWSSCRRRGRCWVPPPACSVSRGPPRDQLQCCRPVRCWIQSPAHRRLEPGRLGSCPAWRPCSRTSDPRCTLARPGRARTVSSPAFWAPPTPTALSSVTPSPEP